MGASGVGKSTLFKKLNQSNKGLWINIFDYNRIWAHKNDDKLITSNELLQKIAEKKHQNIYNSTDGPSTKLRSAFNSFKALKQDSLPYLFNKNQLILAEEHFLYYFNEEIVQMI